MGVSTHLVATSDRVAVFVCVIVLFGRVVFTVLIVVLVLAARQEQADEILSFFSFLIQLGVGDGLLYPRFSISLSLSVVG